MAEQHPASDEMRWLFLQAFELHTVAQAAATSPAGRVVAWLDGKKALQGKIDALHARLRAEGAEREQMRALLERLVAEFDPLFEPYSNGPDEWLCPLCHQSTPAVYDPPGELRPAPEPFPHLAECVLAAAHALLAKMETGEG